MSDGAWTRLQIYEAMQDAWDTICSDTGCHPDDLRREGTKLFFAPGHWADLIALYLDARDWETINTAPKNGSHIIVGTFPCQSGQITTAIAHWSMTDAEWALSVNYAAEHSNHGIQSPTHWRPIGPLPPFVEGTKP